MTPTDVIQRLRLVLTDRALTLAERVAVAAIVLHADRAGIAWPGYRRVRNVYGVNLESAVKALGDGKGHGKAIGRHLERIGRGAHGTWRFRVLPPGASVRPTETLDAAPAFGSEGASVRFPARQRSVSAAPAFRPTEQNVNSKDKREPTAERKEARGESAAALAVSPLFVADVQRPTTATAKKTATSPHAALVKHWCACWKGLYHADYPFNGRDAAHLKALLGAVGNLADAQGIIGRYLACRDRWFTERRHALKYLAGDLPRFLAADAAGPLRAAELPYAGANKPLPRAHLADKPAGAAG